MIDDTCFICAKKFPVNTQLMLPGEKLNHICPNCEDARTEYLARLNSCTCEGTQHEFDCPVKKGS